MKHGTLIRGDADLADKCGPRVKGISSLSNSLSEVLFTSEGLRTHARILLSGAPLTFMKTS